MVIKPHFLLIIFLMCSGCTWSVKPIHVNSDPNEEFRERMREKTELDNIEAFIAEHPELDAPTKKALRNGTISRHEALEELKKKKSQTPQ